ncbi:hypothetical protein KC318_g2400 [Hortaea werneckii]|uniref:Impact N-terminal domain-containing protein n=1 Tax=Hortaea werneckii TaxID=91943 RepID=A0A3M7A056_HORWE|nr:hypothetical protein KC334_g2577 [Hortaea werneckii]KAI7021371.1 hypothetical protein KC355_g2376 [Hortaea werneckii]KAI7673139.1 hypothetical protein KC318_g2400 [Hortaea werneckii]RMY20832.1 hypothetical protein D0867_03712 [Hortaea werneckii]RMY36526.1 hypothetical protein D0866_03873 [Hortaea werneckii]
MSQKRKLPEDESSYEDAPDVFRSDPIEDRSSTFVGYFSPSLEGDALQRLPEIKSATHKILGYRKESNQRSLTSVKQYVSGNDDDGEKYAGRKVEKILEGMRVGGACVVARWYGGVMLGPVRFTHVENCARAAVSKWQTHEADQRTKRMKLEQEAAEQKKLAVALVERDRSIEVLRNLAAGKEKQVKEGIVAGVEALAGANGASGDVAESTPKPQEAADLKEKPESASKPAMDYSAMPLARLRALDKARDATLSFLLKRIDKADADLSALKHSEEAEDG